MSREQFIKMESTPHEDAMKTGEMTTDSEYYKNLVDKAVAGFERISSSFERSSGVGKMLSNSSACYRETVCERESINVASCNVVLLQETATATPTFSNHHPDQSAAIIIKAQRVSTSKPLLILQAPGRVTSPGPPSSCPISPNYGISEVIW